jgi:hypothetical protein
MAMAFAQASDKLLDRPRLIALRPVVGMKDELRHGTNVSGSAWVV